MRCGLDRAAGDVMTKNASAWTPPQSPPNDSLWRWDPGVSAVLGLHTDSDGLRSCGATTLGPGPRPAGQASNCSLGGRWSRLSAALPWWPRSRWLSAWLTHSFFSGSFVCSTPFGVKTNQTNKTASFKNEDSRKSLEKNRRKKITSLTPFIPRQPL